jgi:hypothetical protein
MSKIRFFQRKIITSTISVLLVFGFILAPISHTFELKKVHADIVFDPTAFAQQLVQVFQGTASLRFMTADEITQLTGLSEEFVQSAQSIMQTGLQQSLNIKEYTLDPIAWGLANMALQQMIRSTTQWVNSGFQGSPAFVTDINGFLTDIADKAAGNFIYGSSLNALCSPFKLNIQLALDLQFQRSRNFKAKCTLTGVIKNLDGFLKGDFAGGGGWDAFYDLTVNNDFNPYGAYNDAQVGMYASIRNARGQELKLLDFGSGFLTMKNCKPSYSNSVDGPDSGSSGRYVSERCTNTTPGVVIQDQLNKQLGYGGDKLVAADEIDELIGAVLGQLTKQVLGGVGGLLGVTDSNYGGGSSYFSRADAAAGVGGSSGGSDSFSKTITAQIAIEKEYIAINNNIINLIPENVQATNSATIPACSSIANSVIQLKKARTSAQSELTILSDHIPQLETMYSDYLLLTDTTTSNSTLDILLAKYSATDVPTALSNLMSNFATLMAAGAKYSAYGIDTINTTTIPRIKEDLQKVAQCQ